MRDLFRLNVIKADALVDKLTTLMKQSKDLDATELYTRLVSHLAFSGAQMSDLVVGALLMQLQKNAFNSNREFQKL